MDPTVMHTEDGYLVTFDELDPIVFEFGDVSEKAHEIVCDVTVTRQSPSLESFTERLNILSASSKESFRRSLDAMWEEGKGFWTHKLNQATAGVRAAHRNRDWAENIKELDVEAETPYLWHPLIPEQGHTLWFGEGDSGKSYIALAAMLSVAYGGDWLGYQGSPSPILFIDYESGGQIVKRRLLRIAKGLGLTLSDAFYDEMFHYWPGNGSVPSMLPALKRKVSQGIRLVVIDSAALGAGGSPQDEQIALAFFNAVKKLGVPCVTLAHVTKGGEDNYPFGSIFWSNSARATWNVKGAEERESMDGMIKEVGFYQRKGNEDRKHAPVGFKLIFGDGTTEVRKGTISGELAEHLGLGPRIRKVLLTRGKATIKEIQLEVGGKNDSIYRQLKRMPDVLFEGERGSHETRYFIVSSDISDEVRGDVRRTSSDTSDVYRVSDDPMKGTSVLPANVEQWWAR